MVVFQNRVVIIFNGNIRVRLDVKLIWGSIVAYIVQEASQHHRKNFTGSGSKWKLDLRTLMWDSPKPCSSSAWGRGSEARQMHDGSCGRGWNRSSSSEWSAKMPKSHQWRSWRWTEAWKAINMGGKSRLIHKVIKNTGYHVEEHFVLANPPNIKIIWPQFMSDSRVYHAYWRYSLHILGANERLEKDDGENVPFSIKL